MVGPYLNQLGGNVDDDVALFSGGLNTYVDKAFLESDQMPYVMNMQLGSAPGIVTRPSRNTIAEIMQNTAELDIGSIIDIFPYDEYRFFVIAKKNGQVHIYQFYRPYSGGVLNDKFKVQDVDTIPDEPNYYFAIARRADGPRVYITGLTFKEKLDVPLNPGGAVPRVEPDPEEPLKGGN